MVVDAQFYHRSSLIILLLLGAVSAVGAEYRSIVSEELFRQKVVGHSLSWQGGFNVRFTTDGIIKGKFPNGGVSGTWRWQDGLFCRSISIAGIARPSECLGIEIEQNRVRFRRSDGRYFLPYVIGKPIE